MDGTDVLDRIEGTWPDVIADMEATADEYRDRDWEVIALHPGDVTTRAPNERSDRYGIDVLLPGDEYEAVAEQVENGATFDSYQVYKAIEGRMVYLVVAMEDAEHELAVVYPAYYDSGNASGMLDAARENGDIHSYLRKLERGHVVTLTHEDPEPFFPD